MSANALGVEAFRFETLNGMVFVRLLERQESVWFSIQPLQRSFETKWSPGKEYRLEGESCRHWGAVRDRMHTWLEFVNRELAAAARIEGESGVQAPAWALEHLPPDYADAVRQIAELQERERRLRRMSGLLWETGEPLNRLVRDAFREIGFPAETTAPGATFDVVVSLSVGRLLVEVTGIDGAVNKASKKIAQVLNAKQSVAADGDRVCIAVNAHRTAPIEERKGREIVTRDALGLLVGLDAVVFTTSDLYRIWLLARTAPEAARSQVEAIRTARAGIVIREDDALI